MVWLFCHLLLAWEEQEEPVVPVVLVEQAVLCLLELVLLLVELVAEEACCSPWAELHQHLEVVVEEVAEHPSSEVVEELFLLEP